MLEVHDSRLLDLPVLDGWPMAAWLSPLDLVDVEADELLSWRWEALIGPGDLIACERH